MLHRYTSPDAHETDANTHRQIYFDALGKKGALGFMGVLIVIQFLIGLSLVLLPSPDVIHPF